VIRKCGFAQPVEVVDEDDTTGSTRGDTSDPAVEFRKPQIAVGAFGNAAGAALKVMPTKNSATTPSEVMRQSRCRVAQ
jgi:hypothetical protein